MRPYPPGGAAAVGHCRPGRGGKPGTRSPGWDQVGQGLRHRWRVGAACRLDGGVLAVGFPHTLVSFVNATEDGFHQVVKIDTEEPYWDGFQAGAADVYHAVEPLLHRPMR